MPRTNTSQQQTERTEKQIILPRKCWINALIQSVESKKNKSGCKAYGPKLGAAFKFVHPFYEYNSYNYNEWKFWIGAYAP